MGDDGEWFRVGNWQVWVVGLAILVFIIAAWLLLPWGQIIAALMTPDTVAKRVGVWVVASLLCFALANALYYFGTITAPLQTPNAAIVFSVFWAVAIAVLILLLIFSLKQIDPVYGVFSGIAGGVLGWLLGMYISPEGTAEQQQFAKIGTSVVALFSGYSLKVVVDWLGKDDSKTYRPYCGLLALSAAVSAAAVYNARAYGRKGVTISPPSGRKFDAGDKQAITIPEKTDITFTAAVTGVTDTSVIWEIVPDPGNDRATIKNGCFEGIQVGTYKVLARSNLDPKMADTVDVVVKKKATTQTSVSSAPPANP